VVPEPQQRTSPFVSKAQVKLPPPAAICSAGQPNSMLGTDAGLSSSPMFDV